MSLKFYNTASRKKEDFEPLKPGEVKLYTCGPTVYDQAHIGNFRTFLFEDLLKRFLILRGFKVTHVMNITDVDDKTIKRSREQGMSIRELTETNTDRFFQDLKTLRIVPADHYPKATDYVDDMIAMVETLVANDAAYVTDDGSVYFSISKYPDYGKLAHLKMESMRIGERVLSDDYAKDNPTDFVLWKAWKPEDGPVKWSSPWGEGRPGWHIECSVMSTRLLGDEFDIHCGGVDNIFPHHENEIAQSKCAGKPFARYWLHSEHLMVDSGKMSKSLGNFYRLSDLLDKGYRPEVIRYMMLSGHYRTKLNFSISKYDEAAAAVQRINTLQSRFTELSGDEEWPTVPFITETGEKILSAMDDDLDVPAALSVIFDWVRAANVKLDQREVDADFILSGIRTLDLIDRLFGCTPKPEKDQIPAEVESLVQRRQDARKAKDWALADEIRDKLAELGWEVKDTPEGAKVSQLEKQDIR